MEEPTATASTGPLLSWNGIDCIEPTATITYRGCGDDLDTSLPIRLVHRSPSAFGLRSLSASLSTSKSREVREGKSLGVSSDPPTGDINTILAEMSRKKCTSRNVVFFSIGFQRVIGYALNNFA